MFKQFETATKRTIQRVVPPPTLEGGGPIQRVSDAPKITTSTNHVAPATHKTAPRTHSQTIHNNTPGAIPAIIRTEEETPPTHRSPRFNNIPPVEAPIITGTPTKRPANQLPFYSPGIISQEAVNILINNIYYQEDQNPWLPSLFITSAPSTIADNYDNYDINIEHFCAPVIHPITGETITQYQKLMRDRIMNKT